ncbi:MAG: signal recognition particle protein [Candidatus Algichlamydia australiensis]|nr:signal recognition particle protein [Chlamydiales bacterium]
MLGIITEKFQNLAAKLSREKKLTEENLRDAVREVRLALLEADVNFGVVSSFIKRVKEKAIGESSIKNVTSGDQFIKIVHDELIALMGGEEPKLHLKGDPTVILLCGLQGSGKTTTCAKLAKYLAKKPFEKNPLIAACDLQRAAAITQLKTMGESANVPVFALEDEKSPVKVAKKAYKYAKEKGHDLLILDTAGRLHVDEELMKELTSIKKELNPQETLFVASASMGQDAVKTAAAFDEAVGLTGSILTMLDGNARAGAAISILEVTGKPLKFEGVGEKISEFQLFNPISMADRILGKGDVINLVKKAEEHFDAKESEKLEKKIRKAEFTFGDFLKQMKAIKRMGSIKGLMKMLPGFSGFGDFDVSEKEFTQIEAIILSMTPDEREDHVELLPSRRRRIAKGSGTSLDRVNRIIKQFRQMKKFLKKMPKSEKKLGKIAGKLAR